MSINSAKHRLISRLGGLTTSQRHDGPAITAKARAIFNSPAYWEALADPDGLLSDAERTRRGRAKRKAHYLRMALASSDARSRRSNRRQTRSHRLDAA